MFPDYLSISYDYGLNHISLFYPVLTDISLIQTNCFFSLLLSICEDHYVLVNIGYIMLKLVSAIFYQIFIFSSNDRPSKTMKNVFHFIEKNSFYS